MKRFLIAGLTLTLCLGLAACGGISQAEYDKVVGESDAILSESGEKSATALESVPESTLEQKPESKPEQRADTDFRNAKWGDSPEVVIQYEDADFFYPNSEPAVENNILLYNGQLAGIDTSIIYKFDSELGLYESAYSLQAKHTTDQLYLTDYEKLKNLLKEKYGTQTEDEIITLNKAAEQTDEGTALKYGYRIYRVRWETDKTEIMLGMMADNFVIQTIIQYTSKEITPTLDTSGF